MTIRWTCWCTPRFPCSRAWWFAAARWECCAWTTNRGADAKLLAVPTDDICPLFVHWKSISDVPEIRLKQIQHFFEHYKDLEAGKWVKVVGWAGLDVARSEIMDGIKRYNQQKDRPAGG